MNGQSSLKANGNTAVEANGTVRGFTAPSIAVVKDVANTKYFVSAVTNHFADVMGSQYVILDVDSRGGSNLSYSEGVAPIVAGFWKTDDICDNVEVFEAEWDEVKYAISGTSIWQDVATGTRFEFNQGDMLWIPKGSKSTMCKSHDFSAVYVEQTLRPTMEMLRSRKDLQHALSDMLASTKAAYIAKNPLSLQSFERACKSLPGGNTRSVLYHTPFPMTLVSGRDCHVTSLDSEEYLDLVSEYTAGIFGHSNVHIQQAAIDALAKGFNLGSHNQYEVQLAEALVRRFPSIDLVRFTNSGTEANMMAIALAKVFTGRSKILVFTHGYHGGVLAFEDEDITHTNPLNLPHDFVVAKYNDISSAETALNGDIAAILIEPMQSAGGMVAASQDFLRSLRQAADCTGALLIFDEVVTARLHIHGLQGQYNIIPDLTTLGKTIGGGLSIGAFGGRRDIMERLDPRRQAAAGQGPRLSHSGTFNNNLFSMIAGVAADRVLTQDKILELNRLGDQLRSSIAAILASCGLADWIKVTGLGSLMGFHFSGPEAASLQAALYFHMLHNGIYMGSRGFMALNFEHKPKHVEQVLYHFQTFAAALSSPLVEVS